MNPTPTALNSLGLLIAGCSYDNDEVYFRKLSKDGPLPDIQLKLNLDINSDTFYVYSTAVVSAQVELNTNKFYGLKFFVDDQEVNYYSTGLNQYQISFNVSGKANLRMEFYTSTETGSIADKVGAEQYVLKTKNWNIVYVQEKPEMNYEIVDGRLKLSWTPNKNKRNVKYQISIENRRAVTSQNWYIDSTYVGGNRAIYVYDADMMSGYNVSTEVNYPLPKAWLTRSDSFRVSWEKCKFFNNFKGFRITHDFNDSDPILLDANDTSYVFNKGYFGSLSHLKLEMFFTNSLTSNISLDYVSGYYPCDIFGFFPDLFNDAIPKSGKEFYFVNGNGSTLNKYSLESKSVTKSVPFNVYRFAVSPNGKYILYHYNGNLYLVDASTLSLINTLPTSLIGESTIRQLSISDEGTGIFYDYSTHNLKVYDLINEQTLDLIPIVHEVTSIIVSSNGKYIYIPELNILFQENGNSHKLIWSNNGVDPKYKYFDFFPHDPEKIILYDGKDLIIKNCGDSSIIKSIPFTCKKIFNIDFDNGNILSLDSYKLNVNSISDGTLKYSIPTYLDEWSQGVFLKNNYIISSTAQVKIKTN